jgi:Right handed beta helix region/PKD domain
MGRGRGYHALALETNFLDSSIFARRLCAFIAIVLFSALGMASSSLAATYYVATNGDDAYNGRYPTHQGGSNGPFCTLNRAAYRVQAGDTVQIRGGTYQESVDWNQNGTSANRITITNYNDEAVVIDGGYALPGKSVYYFLVIVSGNYVTLQDITIKRSSGGLLVISGDYSRAVNVFGNGSRETGIELSGNFDLLDGCRMTDNGNGYGSNGQTTWGAAIGCQGNNATIKNCISYENRGEGINIHKGATNIALQDCVIYDNKAYNLYLQGVDQVAVRRNLVYQTKPEYRVNGITIGAETAQPSKLSIYNNLVMGCRVNFEIDSNVTTLSDVLVAYNTFVNSVGGVEYYNMGVYYRRDIDTYINSVFKNNIVLEENPDRIPISVESSHPGLIIEYNCWNKTPVAAAQGAGDIVADPLLAKTGSIGPGQLTPGWFRILENSPARDRAQVLSEVTHDFFGNPRGTSPDMGAHEFIKLGALAQGTPNIGEAPLTVNFLGIATGGAPPYSYNWIFGERGSSTRQNTYHTYLIAGNYIATFTVTDSEYATASISIAINVRSGKSLSPGLLGKR